MSQSRRSGGQSGGLMSRKSRSTICPTMFSRLRREGWLTSFMGGAVFLVEIGELARKKVDAAAAAAEAIAVPFLAQQPGTRSLEPPEGLAGDDGGAPGGDDAYAAASAQVVERAL